MDRNTSIDNLTQGVFKSLSARRAWIEILYYGDDLTFSESLSARRAWIEIATSLLVYLALIVALRKESVDRNTMRTRTPTGYVCRSPQGERG